MLGKVLKSLVKPSSSLCLRGQGSGFEDLRVSIGFWYGSCNHASTDFSSSPLSRALYCRLVTQPSVSLTRPRGRPFLVLLVLRGLGCLNSTPRPKPTASVDLLISACFEYIRRRHSSSAAYLVGTARRMYESSKLCGATISLAQIRKSSSQRRRPIGRLQPGSR